VSQATHDITTIFAASLAAIRNPKPEPAGFRVRDLSVLSYSQGTTMWSYRGLLNGRAADALAPGFFNDAAPLVQHGDLIWVAGQDDALLLYVTGAEGVVVNPTRATAATLPVAA
jgi:hypothetical protein